MRRLPASGYALVPVLYGLVGVAAPGLAWRLVLALRQPRFPSGSIAEGDVSMRHALPDDFSVSRCGLHITPSMFLGAGHGSSYEVPHRRTA
jgi:hypothetical protein